jgi:hypothetical protein
MTLYAYHIPNGIILILKVMHIEIGWTCGIQRELRIYIKVLLQNLTWRDQLEGLATDASIILEQITPEVNWADLVQDRV